MARRTRRSSRRSRRTNRLNIVEIALICLLLGFATYIWHGGTTATPTASRMEQSREKPARPAAVSENSKTGSRPASSSGSASSKTSSSAQKKNIEGYRLSQLADGDSFELVDNAGRKLQVRLYGIDAPEKSQTFGDASRLHLLKLMEGRTFRVQTFYQDPYKRHVALVYRIENGKVDEISLNQRQVQRGMAWVYDQFCTSDFCSTWKVEEALARQQRLGLWKNDSPVPPWQWRRSKKASR